MCHISNFGLQMHQKSAKNDRIIRESAGEVQVRLACQENNFEVHDELSRLQERNSGKPKRLKTGVDMAIIREFSICRNTVQYRRNQGVASC